MRIAWSEDTAICGKSDKASLVSMRYLSNFSRRSSVLPFEQSELVPLSELIALEEIEDDDERLEKLDKYLIDTKEALSDLPHIAVSSDQAMRIRNGNPVMITGANAPINEHEVFATDKGKLLAIGEINFGEFKPKRVFVV
ncbi:MAG: tRNA pseudouridine(55) synthase TruB, partial [Lentilitoribacter sp.]